MRRMGVLLLSVLVLFSACGKKSSAPRYAKDSKEYKFFQALAEKAAILNPDQSNELIKTSKFSVRTADIMPGLYQTLSGHNDRVKNMTSTQLIGFVKQIATQEGDKQLLLTAAKENHITVIDDSVQSELKKIYASYGGEEAFTKRITGMGYSLDFVKADVKKNLTIQKYLNEVVFMQIPVSDSAIQAIYEQDKLATVRHILMQTRGKSDAEKVAIRKKMEGLLRRARAGDDFALLAQEYSEDPGSKKNGGLYENFPRGQMVKSFEEAAFNLPVGSISDIVETPYGFHIIKIISRTKETQPLAQVKDSIRNKLAESKKRETYQNLLDLLKKKYKYQDLLADLK